MKLSTIVESRVSIIIPIIFSSIGQTFALLYWQQVYILYSIEHLILNKTLQMASDKTQELITKGLRYRQLGLIYILYQNTMHPRSPLFFSEPKSFFQHH